MMQLYRVGSQWLVENIWPKHQLIAFVADEILFCLYEDIRKVDTGRGGVAHLYAAEGATDEQMHDEPKRSIKSDVVPVFDWL